MLVYSVGAAQKQVDIFKNAVIVNGKQLVPEENHEFRIQLDVKKKHNWGQIENSCRIQEGNVDEIGLGSGVSRLMKEEMFPAADEAQITAGEAIRAH